MEAVIGEICRLFARGNGFIPGMQIRGLIALRGEATVERALEELHREGLSVSESGGGWTLLSTGEMITAEAITACTPTRSFGRQLYIFPELESTNSLAKSLAEKSAAEGVLVLAETQSKGRGRMGKSWFSPAGTGLWFSIILRPYLPPSAVAPLTILTAVSLARAVSQICAITPLIKWPNDLITNGKKFAGILAEASVAEGAVKYVVVGVGVNVNIPAKAFPEEIAGSATSLMVETHKTHDRARLLGKFLSIFESNYLNYNSGVVSLGELLADIETLRGETVEVVDFPRTGDSIIGRVLEYAEDGSLSLHDEQAAIHHISTGSLRLLPA